MWYGMLSARMHTKALRLGLGIDNNTKGLNVRPGY